MSGRETNLSVSPAGLPVPGGSQPLWSPAALLANAQFAQTWTVLSSLNFWQVGVLQKMAHGDMMGGAELTKPSLMFQLSNIYSSLMTYSTASSPFQLGGSPELNSFGSGVAETLRTGRRTTGTTVSGIFLTRNLAGFFASQRFQIGRHTVFYSGF